jgi:DNA polymerase-3 subunit gamma/tau
MLGLADRAATLDLYEAALGGDAPAALAVLGRLHAAGADPAQILEDLLELTHLLTRLRLAPGGAGVAIDLDPKRMTAVAEKLSMPVLTRTWQLLLKGVGEVQMAPNPQAAAEMVVLRLTFAADLPPPADLVRQLRDGAPAGNPAPRAPRGDGPSHQGSGNGATALARAEPAAIASAPLEAALPLAETATPEPLPVLRSFREVVLLFRQKREGLLEYHLSASARLVRFEPGVIELNPLPTAPPNLANRVGTLLSSWTERRWVVGISSAPGERTLAETDAAERAAAFDAAKLNPTVQALMEAFPGAVIADVRDLGGTDIRSGETDAIDPEELPTETGDEP